MMPPKMPQVTTRMVTAVRRPASKAILIRRQDQTAYQVKVRSEP